MKKLATLMHIAISATVGAVVAASTPAVWIAGSLWASAAMLITAAVATVEDAEPGGFENPEGSSPGAGTSMRAFKLAISAAGIAALGFAAQFTWLR